jgi:hypothetical protein
MDSIERMREADKFPRQNETFSEFQKRRGGGSLVERLAMVLCAVAVAAASLSAIVEQLTETVL